MRPATIIVFARAPVPGRVKTRLIPRLGAWRAALLHQRLTYRAVRTAIAARCGPVELHTTRRHKLFQIFNIPLKLQRGRDLGERMQHAFSRARRPAILIGADCPMLEPADLRRAARSLHGGCEAVLSPAEDGGYALIGLRRIEKELFREIEWGSPQVYARTVKKLAGRRWRALRSVWDVDRPEDLERLRALRFSSASRRAARR